jgi:hypothetical protein
MGCSGGGWAGRLWDKLAPHFGGENLFMNIDTIEPGNGYAGLGFRCAGDNVP